MKFQNLGFFCLLITIMGLLVAGCKSKPSTPKAPSPQVQAETPATQTASASWPNGLLLALSTFPVDPTTGKAGQKPGPATLLFLYQSAGTWKTEMLEDAESNVFHKSMVWTGPDGNPGILTLGGSEARVKLWHKHQNQWNAKMLWSASFGGKWNRMRDAEIAPLLGGNTPTIAVATHDQGVVALLSPKADGTMDVKELDRTANTFVHEIEIGDLDGDKTLEVYATPSEPNDLGGKAQSGKVMRYVPSQKDKPKMVADLGNRHAKEILVTDMDKNGKDELYVAVEALVENTPHGIEIREPVEIRRFESGDKPESKHTVATLPDRFCRFLTAGDLDHDGKPDMIAAGFKSGLWWIKPGPTPKDTWTLISIDEHSGGFEHASKITDLNGDGKDELYVASDTDGEVRAYTWNGKAFDKKVLFKRDVPGSVFTWNIMPFPTALLTP